MTEYMHFSVIQLDKETVLSFFHQPINTYLTFHPEKKSSHTLEGISLHYPFSVLVVRAQQGEEAAVLLGGSLML